MRVAVAVAASAAPSHRGNASGSAGMQSVRSGWSAPSSDGVSSRTEEVTKALEVVRPGVQGCGKSGGDVVSNGASGDEQSASADIVGGGSADNPNSGVSTLSPGEGENIIFKRDCEPSDGERCGRSARSPSCGDDVVGTSGGDASFTSASARSRTRGSLACAVSTFQHLCTVRVCNFWWRNARGQLKCHGMIKGNRECTRQPDISTSVPSGGVMLSFLAQHVEAG